MDYTRTLTLDMNAYGELPVVAVKQGDASARYLTVTLQKDGIDYTPESGVQVLFRCEKPDGHAVLEDSLAIDTTLNRYLVIINNDGTISIELVAQTTTCVGRCRCDLCLIKNEKTLSTIPFVLHVLPSPDVATLTVSTDDFRTLNNTIAEAQALVSEVLQSVATLNLSTNWSGSSAPYTQNITVSGYTATGRTKVDLQANKTAIDVMTSSGTTSIYVVNNGGTFTANALGKKPTSAISVQVTLSETIAT